ncbi:MAG: M13 family metallopeptidase [Brevundimonas sp.]
MALKTIGRKLVTAGVAAILAGCAVNVDAVPVATRYGAFGIDLDARDASVAPGDDFWAYANGGWAQSTPFTLGVEALGVGVDVSRQTADNVGALFEDFAAGQGAQIANAGLLGDLYASWMDEGRVEARGLAPAEPWLARIQSVETPGDIQRLLADVAYPGPLQFRVAPHPDDPTRNIVAIGQGGLGMPRDYYLLEGESYARYRRAYLDYMSQLLTEAGVETPSEKAAAILRLETEIAQAQAQKTTPQTTDQTRLVDLAELDAAAPGFEWSMMFETAGLPSTGDILLEGEDGLAAVAPLIETRRVSEWRDYLYFRFLNANAPYLPHAFASAHSTFYLATLGGGEAEPARSRRGIALAEDTLGDAVGSAYAERYLSPEAVRQVQSLVEDVREAYRRRIVASPWMDEATKAGALEKVATLRAEIGAPRAPDYASLRLHRADLFGNIQRIGEYQRERDRHSLATPRDTAAWPIVRPGPQGYYYAQANSIRLQAALLQPPYFDPSADPAVNYGAIGAFIGHEIGHAFDAQGSRFDAQGRQRDWWSSSSREAFERRIGALDAQYAQYEAAPGVAINVARTSGENIADLAGLEAAYLAYQIHLEREGPSPRLSGLTGAQRFFLANAQMRRTLLQADVARQLVAVGVHSPSRYRVNGVVRNVDGWYETFAVTPGNALYLSPEARVRMW